MGKRVVGLAVACILAGAVPAAFGDLVGWWTMDEGTGTVAHDASGNGYDGNFEGTALWTSGMRNGAIDLNGKSCINCVNPAKLQIAGPMTIACWIKPAALAGQQALVARDASYVFKMNVNSLRFTTPGVRDHSAVNTTLEAKTWQHVAVTFQPGQARGAAFYLNGTQTSQLDASTLPGGTGPFRIGNDQWNEWFTGQIDEVRVYTHVLTELEIRALMMNQTYPFAVLTAPADRSAIAAGQVVLEWRKGPPAVSHRVYFSADAQAVADGAAGALVGTTTDSRLEIGTPSSAYPAGLAVGRTYYWRVDEVNDANPQSPWTGSVWSFSTRPAIASSPVPADGVRYVDLNQDLAWQTGVGAVFHTAYFGDNREAVANATTGGLILADAKYDPGLLKVGTSYYWRIDEFSPTGTLKGDVWTFRTISTVAVTDPNLLAWWALDEGAGGTLTDWSGHGHSGRLMGGTQWTCGYAGAAGLLFDGSTSYATLGTPSDLYLPKNYTYSVWFKAAKNIYANSGAQYLLCLGSRSDLVFGVEDSVGVNGDLSLHYYDTTPGFKALGVGRTTWDSEWHIVTATKDAAVGHKIYLDGELKNSDTNIKNDNYAVTRAICLGARAWSTSLVAFFNGVIDEVRIYNRALTDDEIKQLAAGNPVVARDPSPARAAVVDIRDEVSLSWTGTAAAVSHDVYFGTDRNAVAGADKTSAQFKGNQAATDFAPAGLVAVGGGDYFWRIDEIAADGTVHSGDVWSFTMPSYLVVDNFESYTANMDARAAIFQTWIDGVENKTGAYVGYPTATGGTFGEFAVVHGGAQSMPLDYNNVTAPYYSETSRTWDTPQNWTSQEVNRLSLYVKGKLTNVPATLHVAVEDKAGHIGVVSYPDLTGVTTPWWQQWSVPLSDFRAAGVNLGAVKKMYLSVGSRTNPAPGGAGRLYLDDIRLIKQ